MFVLLFAFFVFVIGVAFSCFVFVFFLRWVGVSSVNSRRALVGLLLLLPLLLCSVFSSRIMLAWSLARQSCSAPAVSEPAAAQQQLQLLLLLLPRLLPLLLLVLARVLIPLLLGQKKGRLGAPPGSRRGVLNKPTLLGLVPRKKVPRKKVPMKKVRLLSKELLIVCEIGGVNEAA